MSTLMVSLRIFDVTENTAKQIHCLTVSRVRIRWSEINLGEFAARLSDFSDRETSIGVSAVETRQVVIEFRVPGSQGSSWITRM